MFHKRGIVLTLPLTHAGNSAVPTVWLAPQFFTLLLHITQQNVIINPHKFLSNRTAEVRNEMLNHYLNR